MPSINASDSAGVSAGRRAPPSSTYTFQAGHPMPYAATAISLIALIFTIAAFWWLHARRGSLIAAAPRVYAFSDAVRLRLPLVFYNSGARALIVGDLRVVVEDEPLGKPLRWVTTRRTLRPTSDDGHTFATPFAVEGRTAREAIAEFEGDWAPVATDSYGLRVQAQVHPSEDWQDVVAFRWWAPPLDLMKQYIAHRNEPIGS
jgi:hypothetical protein